jgi:Zn-dependent protease
LFCRFFTFFGEQYCGNQGGKTSKGWLQIDINRKGVITIFRNLNEIKELLYTLPLILFSLTTHEFFHAFTAYKMGDNTPLEQGRVTMNPLPHIDWFGLALMIFARFGWAKPVQINPDNFRKPKSGEILVSLAGPAANLVLAVAFGLIFKALVTFAPQLLPNNDSGKLIVSFFTYAIWINLGLAVFNLLPIPPLDGSHLLMVIIPDRFYEFKRKLLQFGSIVLMVLLVAGSQFKLDVLPLFPVTDFLFKSLVHFLAI